jgi:glycosyltransferase involved in cell wall biosynthesis
MDERERLGYARAERVFVNYDCVRKLLAHHFGVTKNVQRLAYASEAAFAPSDVPGQNPARRDADQAPLVVAVSRHDPRKGVDILLRAMAELRRQGVPCRGALVGGGPLLAAHRKLTQRLGLDGQVTIEGFVADPGSYLRQADVFALPSLEEGSGSLSLLEALQAGVACVASNVDGIAEDIRDGENGLLVSPGDPHALALAIGRLLVDAELRRRLGRNGRETFERRFSASTFVADLARAYAELGFVPGHSA